MRTKQVIQYKKDFGKDIFVDFPESFKQGRKYARLVSLVKEITFHEAMKVREKHVLDNMIRASLLFTICFYSNTSSLLYHYLGRLGEKGFFRVKENTEFLRLFLDLAVGELATKNIKTNEDIYSPHYLAMKEAAKESGIDVSKIEKFVKNVEKFNVDVLGEEVGFSKEVIDYLIYSEKCSKSFRASLATVTLRELTLPLNFRIIRDNLPKDKKYSKYNEFLSKHIELDENEHSKLMKKALEEQEDVDRLIEIMINFYTLRKRIYDSCLKKEAIY